MSPPGGAGGNSGTDDDSPSNTGAQGRSGSNAQAQQSISDADRESMAMDLASWLWGTLEGGFNEKQSTSQIIVDAAITMIPVVGDVAVTRDLLACVLRMVNDPARRTSKLEWLQLTLLVIALLPLMGGVIKGVGRIALKDGTLIADLIAEIVEFLNHVGIGDAVKWLKELKLLDHIDEIKNAFQRLMTRLIAVCQKIKSKVPMLSAAMSARIDQFVALLDDLARRAESMIPDAVRDIWKRLEAIQEAIYEGHWHPAAVGAKTATRTLERRLVKAGGNASYEMSALDFPGLKSAEELPKASGWPVQETTTLINPEDLAKACHGVPVPVWLPPGTELSRVMSKPVGARGIWWILKKDFPESGKAWREDFAVLEAWSANGLMVSIVVPDGGAWVWVSQAASQLQTSASAKAAGQYLRGGATQIFLDLDDKVNQKVDQVVRAAPVQPTNWPAADLQSVGTPPLGPVVTDRIDADEVLPKPGILEQLPTGSRLGAAATPAGNNQSEGASP